MAVTAGCCSGGDPFTCDQLGGCSITDLGDVDTTTTAPSPGDILVWDGSQWVPGPPGGTTVVGGETPTSVTNVTGGGTEDDPYVVTNDVKVAGGDNAMDVRDGGLYVPKHYFDALHLQATSVAGLVPFDEVVTPGSGRTDLVEMTTQFANPSPDLPMRVVLEASLNHGQFGMRSPGLTAVIYTRVEVTGAVETAQEVHQRILDGRSGPQEIDIMGSTRKHAFTIPPGGIINLRLLGQMNLITYTGSADINELNHRLAIWGGTTF